MEYEKNLISLYLEGDPLPVMFVCLNKRADKFFLVLQQRSFFSGELLIFTNGKYMRFNIDKPKMQMLIGDKSQAFESIFIAFYYDDKVVYGKRGIIENEEEVKGNFRKIIEKAKAKKEREKLLEQDRNVVVDSITKKLFLQSSIAFFEQTKNQLYSLFSSRKRAKNIEALIPCSKFIQVGEFGDEVYVGVVYKENLPYAVGIGYKADSFSCSLVHENLYQYFEVKTGKNKEAYFLSFRKASDGDNVWIK